MSEQRVRIEVEEGVELAGGFRAVEGARGHVLVTHPHPLYGGSMHNNVVEALMSAAVDSGFNALRFNFRGVGGSTGRHDDGVGERRDVMAAARWLRSQKEAPLVLLGYSFGALVASEAASGLGELSGGVWVGFPLVLGSLPSWPLSAGPLLLLAGDRDEFTDVGTLETYAQSLGTRGRFLPSKGGDHFWGGRESALIEEVSSFLSQLDM